MLSGMLLVVLWIAVQVLNTDLMILGHEVLQDRYHLTIHQLYLCISAVSIVQISYEYWFFGWAGRSAVRQEPALQRLLAAWLFRRAEQVGMRDRLDVALHSCRRTWDLIRIPLSAIWKSLDCRNHPTVKQGGYTAIIALTLAPFVGTRTVAVLLQRGAHLPGGMLIILFGSAARVAYMLYGLAFVLWLPWWGRTLAFLVIARLFAPMAIKAVRLGVDAYKNHKRTVV